MVRESKLTELAEELQIRGYSERTVMSYVRACRLFMQWSRKRVEELDQGDVRRYLVHLKQKGLSPSTMNQAVCGVRILYLRVLGKPWDSARIVCHRRRRSLPVVLARDEVAQVVRESGSLRNRTVVMTLYSTGMRLGELTHLEIRDIDSAAEKIHIRCGKGGKDRFAPLSQRLLIQLRSYWLSYRPKRWLFPRPDGHQPIGQRSIQRVCRRAGEAAGLSKRVTPHVLRNAWTQCYTSWRMPCSKAISV